MQNYKKVAVDVSLMIKTLAVYYKNYSETKDPLIRKALESKLEQMVLLIKPILNTIDSDEVILANARKEFGR
jgi:hypothetical protein